MRLSAIAFLTLLTLAFAADAAPAPSPRQVEIPSDSGTLHAQLFKPDGDGPFPVVIALHGCGGLAGHSEPVQARYRDWAEQLLKAGKAVLLPDSYGSRELGPQCRVNVKERRVLARRERVADIMASREWLVQQPWALPLSDCLLSGLPDFVRPGMERARPDAAVDRRQRRCQLAAGLPSDGRWGTWTQRAGADRGLSQRLSRFRPRELSAARDRRDAGCYFAGTRPYRYRHGSSRRFAKARRGMAGAVASLSPVLAGRGLGEGLSPRQG